MKKTQFACLVGIAIIAGCDNLTALNKPNYKEEKIENISRIIMQDPKKYIFLIKKDSINTDLRVFTMNSNKVTIKTDVPIDSPMLWAKYYSDGNTDDSLELHMHSSQEMLPLRRPQDWISDSTDEMILK
jgi:hypothetical protein